ncbi:uncharacterized protein F5891DRAFT_981032 [Suillus fuscotomentosus]|uniref:Uncharacterized protein n=1 Tax=Suillus fuscotomentosus TaxID=1912939 RepID=A0AAD4HK32_9AGAM|nr:uncharacterized protein F5891DRAFT_981032 [Suillus fuscotomentosus]KAG1899503.1 hypothetical protein F5891DRAFT_981032 [Suillus fuscotomentosus]
MELEELSADMEEDTGTTDEVDNDDGFVDEVELLDKKERAALNKEIRPVKLALVKILKDATLYFSRATPTNLATVIPAMDHVDKMLMSYSCNKKYLPSIHSAVQLTKKTLNRSHTYRISMVLHPQHKLLYFKAADWEDN